MNSRTVLNGVLITSGIVALLVAVALNWWATTSVSLLSANTEPVTVPVQSVEYRQSSSAALRAVEASANLAYQGGGGLVTASALQAGTPITAHSIPIHVDGMGVMAWDTPVTFYRDLARGSKGPDVSELQKQLNQLDLAAKVEANGVFGAQTDRAVRQFQALLGVQLDGIFRPGYVLRLPFTPFTPDAVSIYQDQVVSRGDAIAKVEHNYNNVVFSVSEVMPANDYEFLSKGKTIEVSLTADGIWNVTDLDAARELLSLVAADGIATASGVIREREPTPALSVPPSALVHDGDAYCVLRAHDDVYAPVLAKLLGTDVTGKAVLESTTDLSSGDAVLLDPGNYGSIQSCG